MNFSITDTNNNQCYCTTLAVSGYLWVGISLSIIDLCYDQCFVACDIIR